MSKDRSLVRASDIAAWTFCHRAWWLAQVRHARHENPAALQRGRLIHRDHGRQVVGAYRYQRVGLALMMAGLVVGGLALLGWIWLGW